MSLLTGGCWVFLLGTDVVTDVVSWVCLYFSFNEEPVGEKHCQKIKLLYDPVKKDKNNNVTIIILLFNKLI